MDKLKQEMSISAPDKYFPPSLQKVFQAIREGVFAEKEILLSLLSTISTNNDWYLIGADFNAYI